MKTKRRNYFKPTIAFGDPGFVFPSGFKIIKPLSPRRGTWATFGSTPRGGIPDFIKQELLFFVEQWCAKKHGHQPIKQIFKEYAGGGRFGIEFSMVNN